MTNAHSGTPPGMSALLEVEEHRAFEHFADARQLSFIVVADQVDAPLRMKGVGLFLADLAIQPSLRPFRLLVNTD